MCDRSTATVPYLQWFNCESAATGSPRALSSCQSRLRGKRKSAEVTASYFGFFSVLCCAWCTQGFEAAEHSCKDSPQHQDDRSSPESQPQRPHSHSAFLRTQQLPGWIWAQERAQPCCNLCSTELAQKSPRIRSIQKRLQLYRLYAAIPENIAHSYTFCAGKPQKPQHTSGSAAGGSALIKERFYHWQPSPGWRGSGATKLTFGRVQASPSRPKACP